MIRDVGARVFEETFGPSNTAGNMRTYLASAFLLERVRSEIEDAASVHLIVDVDGVPAGYAHMHSAEAPAVVKGARPIELVRLYVDHAHHGVGVGAALMQRCIDEAGGAGHEVMYLGVWEHNLRAQALYRTWGFARVGEHTFRFGDEDQVDWLMARPL